ncbi:MAG: hypothetical protein IJX78_04290 [Bacilli bacterium]|nr:hypothetical protein [Bacilli bacterium]
MKIEWFSHKDNLGAVTIYANNICLNKQASNYFVDAYAVAIGVDSDTNNIVIKNVSQEEVDSLLVDKESLNKISIKSSYGRITGKFLIDRINEILKLDFNKQVAYKYNARWNTGSKMLIVECGGKEDVV